MTHKALAKALNVILRDSMEVSTNRTLTKTQYTGTVTLNKMDQVLLLAKIAEVEGCSAEQAIAIFEQRRKEAFSQKALGPKAVFSVGVLVVLLVVAIGLWFDSEVFSTDSISFLIYPLFVLLLVFLWDLTLCRTRRMETAWKTHKSTGDDILQGVEKLTEIYEKPFLKMAGISVLIPACLCVIAIVALIIPNMLPDPLHEKISDLIPIYAKHDPHDLYIAADLLKPLDAQKAERTLTKALSKSSWRESTILAYAELANIAAEAGTISKEFAHAWDVEATNILDPDRLFQPFQGEWLLKLLRRVEEDQADGLIHRFLAHPYIESRPEMLAALGRYCSEVKTMDEILELNASLSVDVFLQAALGNTDMQNPQ